MPRTSRLLLRLALPLLLAAGCRTDSIAFSDGAVVTGTWNGPRLSLALGPSGGTSEYDCAHGTLASPVVLDAQGRFDVPGTHVREIGGPVGDGPEPDPRPARHVGHVAGGVLTILVVVEADTLGPYRLRRDAPVQLVKCL